MWKENETMKHECLVKINSIFKKLKRCKHVCETKQSDINMYCELK